MVNGIFLPFAARHDLLRRLLQTGPQSALFLEYLLDFSRIFFLTLRYTHLGPRMLTLCFFQMPPSLQAAFLSLDALH